MAAASHTLRIHHLDTGLSGGDATIIALWEEDSYGVAKTPLYVVLIDGGYFGSGNTSLTRAGKAYGLTDANKCADVIVATNYDANAISGVLALVKDAAGDHPSTPIVGNSTVFIDGGQPGSVAGDANQSVAQQVAGLELVGLDRRAVVGRGDEPHPGRRGGLPGAEVGVRAGCE